MGAGTVSQRGSRQRGGVSSGGGSPAGFSTGPLTPHAPPARRVGVVAALADEARTLRPGRARLGTPIAVDADVLLCWSGIGPTAARAASEALLAAGATALVSWGVAAGLDATTAPGTLVLADRVVDLPPLDPMELWSSASWNDRIAAHLPPGIRLVRGPIGATDRVLSSRADKRAAASRGAVAADMETAAVARAAGRAGIPWIAVRAVSDTSDRSLPSAVAVAIDSAGRVRLSRLAAGLVRRPAELLQLPGLASGFAAAIRTLRAVSAAIGANLLAPQATSEAPREPLPTLSPVAGVKP
jgi:adenosylhomocysteine nucleosidase